MPLIPPLYYDNHFMTDFTDFSMQCSLIFDNSSIPGYINCTTEKHLSTVALSVEDVSKIFQNLDSNKTHGNDKISFRMLKAFGDSIYKLL